MNSETLITNAAVLIEYFARKHDCACCLSIKDGVILATPKKQCTCEHEPCLTFTKWDQRHGLTNAQWNTVGTELLNLYHKEKLCQKNDG